MARHIYIHIPFCEKKCPYCSFYSVAGKELQGDYFDALRKEIGFIGKTIALYPDINPDKKDTVYFGGGTPSCADEKETADILQRIMAAFGIGKDAEITIEANPHSLTFEKARVYKEAGFNRISIGVQSLTEEVLKTLGRLHDRETALKALRTAQEAGFENISADLMTGVPSQTVEDVLRDAGALIDSGVKHISMYSLSIEEGTLFEKRYGKDLEKYISQETDREMYHALRAFLSEKGYVPYEISNCALKGYESIHNGSYWRGYEYFGLGSGARGYMNGKRYSKGDDISSYIKEPAFVEIEEVMDGDSKIHEYAMLMLRTSEGIGEEEFKERFGRELKEVFGAEIKKNISEGYLEENGGCFRLTPKGLDFANLVFEDFL